MNRENSRYQRAAEAIRSYTREHIQSVIDARIGLTAAQLAEELGIDRSNASRELNALYRSGQTIKLLGRPTLYLHRNTVMQYYPNCFFPTTLPKEKRLADYNLPVEQSVQVSREEQTVDLQIVLTGSLRGTARLARAAVLYPPLGLHTLIVGNAGSGKAYFARWMHQYAVTSGAKSENAPFILYDCQEYEDAPQRLLTQIFGQGRNAGDGRARRGLLEQASGGILCLYAAQKIPPVVQDRLIALIEKNTFTRIGEASPVRYNNAMLILTSSEPPEQSGIARVAQSLPIHLRLPDLDDRERGEVLEYITQFFQSEASAIGSAIHVHRDVLYALLCATYPGNIVGLMGTVKSLCSLAYLDRVPAHARGGNIRVEPEHLQPALLRQIGTADNDDAARLLAGIQQKYLQFTPGGRPPRIPAAPQPASAAPTPILIVMHGDGIAERMSDYCNVVCGKPLTRGLSFRPGQRLNDFIERVCEEVRGMGRSVRLAADMEPLTLMHSAVQQSTGVAVEPIANAALPMLLSLCRNMPQELPQHREQLVQRVQLRSGQLSGSFIDRVINEILPVSLTFLDSRKATLLLLETLDLILIDLGLSCNDEIAIRFLFHCVHMLERLIRGNMLRYDTLKQFISEHSAVFSTVENRMSYPAESFGVNIPASEIAYIAEIFLTYLATASGHETESPP